MARHRELSAFRRLWAKASASFWKLDRQLSARLVGIPLTPLRTMT